MNLNFLPALNAFLNGSAAVFLALGYVHIRRGNRESHRQSMVAAFGCSVIFLIAYITYHTYLAVYLHRGPTVFHNPAWLRPIYLAILLSHTILAVIIVPMALRTIFLAAKGRFEEHRRMARWTWPPWMYVSVTGVIIYFLLYHVNRPD
jgi:uncharacterized membrane protein YozB (DUF420 family)